MLAKCVRNTELCNKAINHTNDSVIKCIKDYGLQLDIDFVNLVLDINNKNFKKHRTLLTKIKNYKITGKNVSQVQLVIN
jgi:hypothetical protein